MAPLLDEESAVENENVVGVLDGAHAVGDEEHGAAFELVREIFADQMLGGKIERAGGFVENEKSGTLEDGAGDGDALALAAGKGAALLSDGGVVAKR
jgi:hypothetical protein